MIEERAASELKTIAGVKIAPDGIETWNPAFDITPASLITAIVTDRGVVRPTEGVSSDKKAFDMKAFIVSANQVRVCRVHVCLV